MKPSESVGVSAVSSHLLVEWRYSEVRCSFARSTAQWFGPFVCDALPRRRRLLFLRSM
jgi:hypothetical protein